MSDRATMRRDDALQILRHHEADLRAANVRSLLLFGSVARDEAGPASDVDLLVEFDRPVGMFALVRLRDRLEAWLGRRVDLLTTDALKATMRDRVMREALRAA